MTHDLSMHSPSCTLSLSTSRLPHNAQQRANKKAELSQKGGCWTNLFWSREIDRTNDERAQGENELFVSSMTMILAALSAMYSPIPLAKGLLMKGQTTIKCSLKVFGKLLKIG